MKRTTQLSFNHELTFAVARPRRFGRWFVTIVVLLLAAGGLTYALRDDIRMLVPAVAPDVPTEKTTSRADQPVAAPKPAAPVVKVDVEYVVRSKDSLGEIFTQLKLDVNQIPAILDLPVVRDRFKPLQPGDRLVFALENGALQRIDRRISETEMLSITHRDNGFTAAVTSIPIEIKTAQVRGTLDTSRFIAGRVVGLSQEMVQQLENDIFAWDIDFARDIRPGDRFNVIYEQRFRGDEYLGDGRIVAAEFVNGSTVHTAVHYLSPDGKLDGYFTPDGHSVHRPFLRTPLDVARVEATTEPEGRELVLNTMSEHHGIDYPAPSGTAVKATGDGRVGFVGVNGEYGNTVVLDHGGGVSTLYAHLSSFADGLRTGQRMTQGEPIGYVGRSGAATAPHLHYEYRVDGNYVDPRTVQQPAGAPIPAAYVADFQSKADALLAALKLPGDAITVSRDRGDAPKFTRAGAPDRVPPDSRH
jgi:murein DD-endopeptidase MepM/ murein hydrolase activator NlpD